MMGKDRFLAGTPLSTQTHTRAPAHEPCCSHANTSPLRFDAVILMAAAPTSSRSRSRSRSRSPSNACCLPPTPADLTADATYGLDGLEVLDGTGTHAAPFDAFNPLSYHGHLGAEAAHEVPPAQPLADPMDLDMDFDAALWAGDLDPMGHLQPDMTLTYGPPMTAMPADFQFAEDEEGLPAGPCYTEQQPSHHHNAMSQAQMQPPEPSPTRAVFSAARSDAGSEDAKLLEDGSQNGMAHERLRRQLSLLSKGWAGDEIRFKNCDPSKAVVLHALAMELGLGYNHDVMSREVSMARLGPVQVASKPQASPRRLSSSLPRSSTELDSALCLPGLPRVPEFQPLDLAANLTIKEEAARAAQAVQSGVITKEQQLTRRPSRSERITDSISKHVSTLKTSIAKGGRRGPLTENGRRDMRALEAAGGACWRCKVLRRKVSLHYRHPFFYAHMDRADSPPVRPGKPMQVLSAERPHAPPWRRRPPLAFARLPARSPPRVHFPSTSLPRAQAATAPWRRNRLRTHPPLPVR